MSVIIELVYVADCCFVDATCSPGVCVCVCCLLCSSHAKLSTPLCSSWPSVWPTRRVASVVLAQLLTLSSELKCSGAASVGRSVVRRSPVVTVRRRPAVV